MELIVKSPRYCVFSAAAGIILVLNKEDAQVSYVSIFAKNNSRYGPYIQPLAHSRLEWISLEGICSSTTSTFFNGFESFK